MNRKKIEKNKDLGVYLNKLIYNECNKHLLKNPDIAVYSVITKMLTDVNSLFLTDSKFISFCIGYLCLPFTILYGMLTLPHMNKSKLLHCCFKTYIGCKDYCAYSPRLTTNNKNCLFGYVCSLCKKMEYCFRLTICTFLELFRVDLRDIILYKKFTMFLLFISLIFSLFPLFSLLMFIYKVTIENEVPIHSINDIQNVDTTIVEGIFPMGQHIFLGIGFGILMIGYRKRDMSLSKNPNIYLSLRNDVLTLTPNEFRKEDELEKTAYDIVKVVHSQGEYIKKSWLMTFLPYLASFVMTFCGSFVRIYYKGCFSGCNPEWYDRLMIYGSQIYIYVSLTSFFWLLGYSIRPLRKIHTYYRILKTHLRKRDPEWLNKLSKKADENEDVKPIFYKLNTLENISSWYHIREYFKLQRLSNMSLVNAVTLMILLSFLIWFITGCVILFIDKFFIPKLATSIGSRVFFLTITFGFLEYGIYLFFMLIEISSIEHHEKTQLLKGLIQEKSNLVQKQCFYQRNCDVNKKNVGSPPILYSADNLRIREQSVNITIDDEGNEEENIIERNEEDNIHWELDNEDRDMENEDIDIENNNNEELCSDDELEIRYNKYKEEENKKFIYNKNVVGSPISMIISPEEKMLNEICDQIKSEEHIDAFFGLSANAILTSSITFIISSIGLALAELTHGF